VLCYHKAFILEESEITQENVFLEPTSTKQ